MLLASYVADKIWLCTYPIQMAGMRFSARMTVIRLSSGSLLLHSPSNITAAVKEEISAIGPVAHIVAPGNFHTMYIATAQAAFPTAKTWICPGSERRRPGLKYDMFLGDLAPADWAEDIDQVLVKGTSFMREVAMFHRASRTLILVDLIENFTDATPNTGGALKILFKYVLRMWDNPRPAPEYRLGWSNRHVAANSLRRVLAWDFQRIVLAHGELIDRNAHEVATAAWSEIIGRS